MARRARNPWSRPETPAEQGRAVIHVSPDAGEIRFSREFLLRLVASRTDASVAWQVGVFGRSPERSAQVVLVNGATWTAPWASFRERVVRLAEMLCEALAQQSVLLETWTANGSYRADLFENPHWAQQRRLLLAGSGRKARALPGRSRR